MSDDLRKVPLDAVHRDLGAKMVPFAGFWMPLQYTSLKEEHYAVRGNAGLFDVSHMGEVEFRGPDAIAAVDRLVTNDAFAIVDGQAMYTAMCNEDGGIVDDLIVYRLAADHVLICVNAANRAKDFAHMRARVSGDVDLTDTGDSWAQLAIQGPNADAVLAPVTDLDLTAIEYYHARFGEVGGVDCLVSRTGYTGEDGFEVYIPASQAAEVHQAIRESGEPHGMLHCGLGCRDTLRLEARYLLYGNDMDESVNPIEAGLGWVTKLDTGRDFVGKDAIAAVKSSGPSRRMRGFVLRGRGVLRPDYPVFHGDIQVGTLTSGSFSPTLEQSIGLGWVAVEHCDEEVLEVEIRGKRHEVDVTKKPFYRRGA